MNPILRISDGTTTINLIELPGWILEDWKPAVAEPKGGGVFRNSPLADGRKLAYRKMDNITDTFNLVGNRASQDDMINSIQELQRLLEKAVSYWTTNWQNEPVWIEVCASNETYPRYATIVDYRLTGFGGPFKQPFFSNDCDSTTDAILVIEHTFWQETEPGEEGACVEVSSELESPLADGNYDNDTFYPAASDEDATYSDGMPVVDTGDGIIAVGYSVTFPGNCQAGILFNTVNVAHDSLITKATLTINVEVFYLSPEGAYINIVAQDPPVGGASAFDGTNQDFIDRTDHTADPKPGHGMKVWIPASGVNVIDVTDEIRFVTSHTNWSSGDNLVLILSAYQPIKGMDITSFDNGSDYPELYIEWSDPGLILGRSATCLHETYVSNKQNRGVITHIFVYDNDGIDIPGNWSDNLLEDADMTYNLLPSHPAADDALYFCSSNSVTEGYGPFCSIVFDLTFGQTWVTGIWQYYSDWTNSWEDYGVSVCGDALNLNTAGVCSVVFEPTVYQAHDHTENAVVGYWVRFLVTNVEGIEPAPPIQHNRHIYTVTNPFVDIDSLQVPGDIPALSRILFDPASCSNWYGVNTIVMGLRSLSRGEDFSAYLNVSDVQNIPGIIFEKDASVSFEENGGTITGRVLFMSGYTPTEGEWNNFCSWTISGDLAKQYLGEYHAYIRGMFSSGHRSNTKLRLRAVFGDEFNTSYSDISGIMAPSATEEEVIDVGKLSIQPSQTMRPRDNVDFIKIYLDIYIEDLFTLGLEFIMDIILIPSDEWIGSFGIPTDKTIYYGKGVDIDGITNPRQYRASETTINEIPDGSGIFEEDDRSVAGEMSRVSSSEPILQANKDQRLWFTQYYNMSFIGGVGSVFTHQNCGKVCAQRSARYIYARGSR